MYRFASSLSLVCQFNFGHDPLFTWWFSSRQFRRVKFYVEYCEFYAKANANTSATMRRWRIVAEPCAVAARTLMCLCVCVYCVWFRCGCASIGIQVIIMMNAYLCSQQRNICSNMDVFVSHGARPPFAAHPRNYTKTIWTQRASSIGRTAPASQIIRFHCNKLPRKFN